MKIKGNVPACEVVKNLILFSFESIDDREAVLRYQSRHFHEELLAAAIEVGNIKPSADLIKNISIWARVYDLPLDDHTEDIFIVIAPDIGELIVMKCRMI